MQATKGAHMRVIIGTVGGGLVGFYVMHRLELKYKEMWEERLKKYEEEVNRRNKEQEAAAADHL